MSYLGCFVQRPWNLEHSGRKLLLVNQHLLRTRLRELRRMLMACVAVAVLLTTFSTAQSTKLRLETPHSKKGDSGTLEGSFAPRDAQDVSAVLLRELASGQELFIEVWSTIRPESNRSVVAVIRRAGPTTRVLRRFTINDAYAPTVIVSREFMYNGSPIALVEAQFGAAACTLEAFGADGGSVRRLASIHGAFFEFVAESSTPYLLAHEDVNLFDVPRLYRWTGSSFVDDSAKHPDFYRRLVAKIRSERDVEHFAPAVQLRFAELVRLSGESGTSAR